MKPSIKQFKSSRRGLFSRPLINRVRALTTSLFALSLLCAAAAVADVRQDAESAVSSLHKSAAAQKFPDDLKSLDLVYEVAQRYFSKNDRENADKFYLLSLQKSQIIESMLTTSEVTPVPGIVARPLPVDLKPPVVPSEDESSEEPDSDRLVGSRGVYTVVKADTVRLVASKLGVTQQHLRSMNGLSARARLKVGQKLAYNNRKIIPQQVKNGIVINIPDRTLYYFQQGTLVTSLPVALGSATKNEKYVWQTPVGKFKITAKMKDPTWTVPPSIQTRNGRAGQRDCYQHSSGAGESAWKICHENLNTRYSDP